MMMHDFVHSIVWVFVRNNLFYVGTIVIVSFDIVHVLGIALFMATW